MVHLGRILFVALQKRFKEVSGSELTSIREAVRWLEQFDRGDQRDAYFHLLRRCIDARAADEGRRLHSLIRRRRYDYDGLLGTLMIRLYSASSSTREARNVYESLPGNSMLALYRMLQGYIANGEIDQARDFFDSVEIKDDQAWTIMLQAYADKGEMLKAYKLFRSVKEPGIDLWVTMIRGYASSGLLEKARALFRAAPGNERLWGAMIAANAANGELDEARKLLAKMWNPSVASCKILFDAYLREEKLKDAQWAFNRIGDVNEAPWMELLGVYLNRDRISEAQEVFRIMPQKTPDAWNLMIAAHAQQGHLQEATELFEKMGSLKRNLVSWNAVMSGYARHGRGKDAVKIFKGMKDRGVKPNRESFEIIIEGVEDSDLADKVLHEVEWSAFVRDVEINNLVLGMFARVGSLEEIRRVFQKLEVKNKGSWSLLVLALARRGMHGAVVEFLGEMRAQDEEPESSMLRGLVRECKAFEDAVECMKAMVYDFGVGPELEDCVCAMKLLKAGELQELIECSRLESLDNIVWKDFIAVCRLVSDDALAMAVKSLSEQESRSNEDSSVKPAEKAPRKEVDEEKSRMMKLEKKAKKSMHEEARSGDLVRHEKTRSVERASHEEAGSGSIFSTTETLRSPGLDLEKFWLE